MIKTIKIFYPTKYYLMISAMVYLYLSISTSLLLVLPFIDILIIDMAFTIIGFNMYFSWIGVSDISLKIYYLSDKFKIPPLEVYALWEIFLPEDFEGYEDSIDESVCKVKYASILFLSTLLILSHLLMYLSLIYVSTI